MATTQEIIKAIRKINSTAQFSISGNDIDSIVWENGQTPIAKADIEAQLSSAQFDIAMENLRSERDKLIAETDFYALSDVTMSAEMTTYRQALRDITNGLTTTEQVNTKLEKDNNGNLINFPTKP